MHQQQILVTHIDHKGISEEIMTVLS